MAISTYSPNQQTKQQLEELDALLQRMLTLPVSGTETATVESSRFSPNPEVFAPSPPTHALTPRLEAGSQPTAQEWRAQTPVLETIGTVYVPMQAPLATPVEVPHGQSIPEPRFFATGATSPQPAASTPPPSPYSMVFGSQSAIPVSPSNQLVSSVTVTQQRGVGSATATPPLSPVLWPVYVLNKLFDLFTWPLGPVGSWLRKRSGRNALAWLGVLMILGAIGWGVADLRGLDWTRWG